MALTTRRRRWIWIVVGVVVGLPLMTLLITTMLMALGGIRDDQLATPEWLTASGENEKNSLSGHGNGALPAIGGATAAEEPNAALQSSRIKMSGPELAQVLNAPKAAYKDYLDLTGVSPDDPRAIAFREIEELWNDKDWQASVMALFAGESPWRPGDPLGPEQAAWLDANRPFLESILALAAAGGLPPVPRQLGLSLFDTGGPNSMSLPNYLMFQTMSRLLALEAQRRMASGNPRGAVEALLAINPLVHSIRAPTLIGHLVGLAMQNQLAGAAEQWLAGDLLDSFAVHHLAAGLEGHSTTLRDTRATVEMEYRAGRQAGLDLLRGPFMDLVKYNLGQSEIGRDWASDFNVAGWLDMVMAETRTVLGSTADAVAASVYMRATAAKSLEQNDAFWRDVFAVYDRGGTSSDLCRVGDNANIEGAFRMFLFNINEMSTRTDATQARLELTRSALERHAGLITPLPEDPFNHEPARTIDTETGTLIYSVGPDLVDQQGALSYDPTNGTISAGDLVVRIPRGGSGD